MATITATEEASSSESPNNEYNSTGSISEEHRQVTASSPQPQSSSAGSPKQRKIRMRPDDDDEEQDWWFASTAIPLVAATTGPLANVMSIAALVTSWRNNYDPSNPGVDEDSVGFPDPKWCLGLNGASLACGFAGNIFLLFNFTRRVRYIVALPMTIILWYFATGILIGITVAMSQYVPPKPSTQTYSQGYWHAVIAAVLYLISSMTLMLNMLGYFLGHYPRHFELTDEQRNLILQTMMFFIWLAGGGAVFARVEGWSYVDALYFCDVTILTVGFGDFHPINDAGRGLVFPYSVGGIIILGLMVSSIAKFAKELGTSHLIRGHVERRRTRTLEHSATSEREFAELQARHLRNQGKNGRIEVSAPSDQRKITIDFDLENNPSSSSAQLRTNNAYHRKRKMPLSKGMHKLRRVASRQQRIRLLKEEKDRFDAMRAIQHDTSRFKKYSALTTSVIAFGVLWCVGAVGFWKAEHRTQNLTYFQALYFCYVSLLTIGYGDLSPTSNAGKPLFIVWSLIAVPTMTILISDMGDTVIASFKRGTFTLADWTVLPKQGIWREFVLRHPKLHRWLERRREKEEEKKQVKRATEGLPVGPEEDDPNRPGPTLDDVVQLDSLDDAEMARRLSRAIRRTTNDITKEVPKRYTYEEWAEYTRLIRFSRLDPSALEEEEEEEGLIEWDWIGEDSPMLAEKSESEWILDRLCESLDRFLRKHRVVGAAADQTHERKHERIEISEGT